jgi:hypothetical protein
MFQKKSENFGLLGDDTAHVGIQEHGDLYIGIYQYTLRHIPKHTNLHYNRCENLKLHIGDICWCNCNVDCINRQVTN